MQSTIFRRDFTMVVIGQIISLFGNAVLRFALSLYVLSLTGSAAVFGGILALSMIPTVLLSPIGGVLADRMPRQKIMVVLDFSTCALILGYALLFARSGSLGAITVFMILLALIQAVYQPSVQASVPSLVDEEGLMAANGVVMQVQALASLLGPILGGVLYAAFGLFPILWVSSACFFASAVLELFIRIPFSPLARTASVAGPDAEYLDEQAQVAYEQALLPAGTAVRGIEREDAVLLDRAQVAALHPALRLRVLATACKTAGGENPGFERLQALDSFTAESAVAGPVQMPGHVSAYRRRKIVHPATGERLDVLVLVPTRH